MPTIAKQRPDFQIEQASQKICCGIDEVGRGPLCGPVVAAAVILPYNTPSEILSEIHDSKKLSLKKRTYLFEKINEFAQTSIGEASVEEIDEINILNATMLAMTRAFEKLQTNSNHNPEHILIDGNRIPKDLPLPAEAVVKGDSKSLSIAAASIIAKHHRDLYMIELDKTYPGYGWAKNAGYGTKQHLEALRKQGVTPHHRRSFRPVYELIDVNN